MKRSQLFAAVAAVVVAGLVFVLWPKRETDPRELIKQRAIQMCRAAEQKDAGFIMEQISQSFRAGEFGGRDQLKGLMLVSSGDGAIRQCVAHGVDRTAVGRRYQGDGVGLYMVHIVFTSGRPSY